VSTALADAYFSLWVGGSAWAPLVVASALAGIVAAVVFRFTSRQDLLRRDAELIQAQLLAMKLFRDDLGTLYGSLGRLLRHTALRLWHSLPPVLVMTVPFVLLLAQLARWYEHAPLIAGDQTIVVLKFSERAWSQAHDAELQRSAAFAVETPSLRDPAEHAVYWRIRVLTPEAVTLRWKLPQQTVEKNVAAAADPQPLMAIDSTRPGSGWIDRLLHPGEQAFHESDPARRVEVQYPQRSTPILGLELPWWATFLLVSIVAAILGGRVMKVQF
jgi:hypothetical protein